MSVQLRKTARSAPWRRVLAGALALAAAAPAAFGAIEFQEEYAKQIKAAETVSPLTGDLFGDSVSLYTGAVEFSATDASLPGNNALPVAFGRRFAIESRGEGAKRFLLGDWDIDIPYISSVHVAGQGWTVDIGGTVSSLRCAGPRDPGEVAPPATDYGNPAVTWLPEEFWAAPTLYIPGRGSNSILFANTQLQQPVGPKQPAKWVTKDNTFLYCTDLAAGSGGQGDGFSAWTPDGFKYTFNHLVTMPYASLIHRTGQIASRVVAREEVRLYPTRIEDRYGNAVVYTWSGGQLQSIRSADGAGNPDRLLTFGYNAAGKIASVSDQSRTWTYGYTNGQLSSVTLPDSSQWTFDFTSILSGDIRLVTQPPLNTPNGPYCNKMVDLQASPANQRTATITHPSGATGTFTFDARRHGRTQVDDDCIQPDKDHPEYHYNRLPTRFDTIAVTSKTIGGAGLSSPYTWTYDYGLVAGATAAMCGPSCVNSKTVTVNGPDGTPVVHTFGVRYGINEGQLLGTTVGAGAGLRTKTFTYASAGGANHPFPASMGTLPYASRTDPFSAAQLHPQNQRTTVQDGATFSWTAQAFDAYARPTREARFGLGFSLPSVDTTTYHDDTTRWVLGQVATVHTSYDTVSRIKLEKTYSAMAEVSTESSWGFLQKQYTYNADGTLATVSDALGASHATTLSNYWRGIPRNVAYPLGASESAVVNNLGQLASVTDELGNTTAFAYWPSGKLQTVTPPAGGTTAWSATNYAIDRIAGNEFGLNGAHWRRTVTTGNRSTVTYYDVLFRPVLVREWDAAAPSQVRHRVTHYDEDGRAVFASVPLASLPLNTTPQDPNYQQPDYRFAQQGTDTIYDELGRTVSVSTDSEIGALMTSYQYLPGFQRRVTNPRGYATTSTFVAWDEPTYENPNVITGEDGVTTSIARTIWGLPYQVTRSGAYGGGTQTVQRRYVYDEYMRLCKTIEPEGGGTIVDYNVVGDVAWTAPTGAATSIVDCQRSTATGKTTRIYNARRWLLGVFQPAGTDGYNQSFDADGALRTIGSAGTLWTYEYNNRRLLEKETLTVDGKAFEFDWTYDANGAVASLTYPDGTYVDYAPDAFGRATRVGAYASGVKYHLNDAIAEFTYSNGVKHEMTPNSRQLPRYSSDKLGTQPVVDYEYQYDANGNVGTITDNAQNGLNSKTLTYDKFDRLTGASAPDPADSASFAYDPADNLRSMTVGTRVYAYTIDAVTNRASAFTENGANAKAIVYDGRGNVSSKGTQTFAFDAANRLLSVAAAPGGSGSEAYVYDGHNRRVSILKGGETAKRYSVYSQGGQLLHELSAQGRPTNYIYLGGTLLARLADGAPANPSLWVDPAGQTSGAFTVNWTGVLTSGNYQLSVRRIGGSAQVYDVAPPTTSKAFSSPDGGTWQFSLNACPTAGACGQASLSNYGVTPKPVSAVHVPGSVSVNSFVVSWEPSIGTDSYRVEQSSDNGASYTTVSAAATGTSITRSNMTNGTYRYRVTAVNNWGWRTGVVSNPVTVLIDTCANVTTLATPAIDPIAPDSPTGYRVRWSQPACANAYTLEESTNGGATWSDAPGYVSPDNPAVFQNRANGTYTYRVRASRIGGPTPVPFSAWSATQSVTIAVSTVPAVPANVRLSATGVPAAQHITVYGNNQRVNLLWNASPGAAHYKARRTAREPECSDLDGVQTVSASPSPALSGLLVPRVCNGVQLYPASYDFVVSACNAEGLCSPESAISSVTVEVPRSTSTSPEAIETALFATYYHTDALGSPVAETNASGTVTKRSRYEPYGAPATGSYENGPGYTGHATDALSRLSYMQQRYYDPALARFLSVDPVATDLRTGESFNRYSYAANNPYRFKDPDGRQIYDPWRRLDERCTGPFCRFALGKKNPDKDYVSRAKKGNAFFDLEDGFEGTIDKWNEGSDTFHEIHVYKNGKEVGLFKNGSFFAKHGFLGDVPEGMSDRSLGKLKGLDNHMLASTGRAIVSERRALGLRYHAQTMRGVARFIGWVGALVTGYEVTTGEIELSEAAGISTLGCDSIDPCGGYIPDVEESEE